MYEKTIKVSIFTEKTIRELYNSTGPFIRVDVTKDVIKKILNYDNTRVIYHGTHDVEVSKANIDTVELIENNPVVDSIVVGIANGDKLNISQWFYHENVLPFRFVNFVDNSKFIVHSSNNNLGISTNEYKTVVDNGFVRNMVKCTSFGNTMIEHDGTLIEGRRAIPTTNGVATLSSTNDVGYMVNNVINSKYAIVLIINGAVGDVLDMPIENEEMDIDLI